MAVAGVDASVPSTFGGFRRGAELGRGASGMVFACNRLMDNQKFAVKAIDLRRLRLSAKAEREQKKLEREVAILKKVPPHPRLVRFVDAMEEGTWFFLVLEFVPGGDLFNNLIARPALPGKRPCFKEAETAHVLNQLIDGLEFLHQHDVIHRDLKLENILVVRERKQPKPPNYILVDIKITDFGLSKIVGDGLSQAHSTVGSPRYIAPEVLARGVHDFRADIWSLGVLLHVLLAGRFPVDGPNNVSQPAIDAAIGRLEASVGARNVVLGLLQVEREKRLSLEQIRDNAWLKETSPNLDSVYPPRGSASSSSSPTAIPITEHPTISLFGSEDDDDEVVEVVVKDNNASSSRSRSKGESFADQIVEVSADIPSIAGLDAIGSGSAVKGTVRHRADFKSGTGFLLRLCDESGEIDVKFWNGAAAKFKEEKTFSKGYVLLLEGFQMVRLKEKDKQFSAAGRSHCLSYNAPDAVRFTVVEAPKAPKRVAARLAPPEAPGEREAYAQAVVAALKVGPKAVPPHVLIQDGQSPRTKNATNIATAEKAEAVMKAAKAGAAVVPRRKTTAAAAAAATKQAAKQAAAEGNPAAPAAATEPRAATKASPSPKKVPRRVPPKHPSKASPSPQLGSKLEPPNASGIAGTAGTAGTAGIGLSGSEHASAPDGAAPAAEAPAAMTTTTTSATAAAAAAEASEPHFLPSGAVESPDPPEGQVGDSGSQQRKRKAAAEADEADKAANGGPGAKEEEEEATQPAQQHQQQDTEESEAVAKAPTSKDDGRTRSPELDPALIEGQSPPSKKRKT